MILTPNNKYDLVLCELYYKPYHGINNNMNSHYLLFSRFKKLGPVEQENDFYVNYDTLDDIYDVGEWIYDNYTYPIVESHPTIRNYEKIIESDKYLQPELAQVIETPTREYVCILKTFWLRLIQRKWKKIYKRRMEIVRRRMNPINFMHFQQTGYWLDECKNLPSIYGMMSDVS
jgi:hypothetical protein